MKILSPSAGLRLVFFCVIFVPQAVSAHLWDLSPAPCAARVTGTPSRSLEAPVRELHQRLGENLPEVRLAVLALDSRLELQAQVTHPELRELGLDFLTLTATNLPHVRDHFLPKFLYPELTNLRRNQIDIRLQLQRLAARKGERSHSVIFATDSLGLFLKAMSGLWRSRGLTREPYGQGASILGVEFAIEQVTYRAFFCVADDCGNNRRRGDLVTLHPLCGPGVFELWPARAISELGREKVAHALTPKPCARRLPLRRY